MRHYKKIFQDPNKILIMSELRQKGWGYTALAMVFGVDHSSIYHECKKFNIPKGKEHIEFGIRTILDTLHIEVKRPKMYADYLRESGYKIHHVSQELLSE